VNNVDNAAQAERALLGVLLETPEEWPEAVGLSVNDFVITDHRKIFAAISHLHQRDVEADIGSVAAEATTVDEAYICGLVDGVVRQNLPGYVRRIRQTAQDREFQRLSENLAEAGREDRLAVLQQIQDLLQDTTVAENWRGLFHPYEEIMNAPPARFAIEGFLQEEGITLIGGLAGHGKTLCMLAMTRALLEGGKLFHHFPVNQTSSRVIYLIPEAGLGPFSARLKTFHLEEHVRDGRLFCRTLSARQPLSLTDPRLLEAVEGADVFLDTAIRFMVGDENSSAEQKLFAETLFNLQRAGARTITGAHHSPKSFGKDSFMTLENILRGSGDIGAMLATCWGLVQIDPAQNRIFVQNAKPRDFEPCAPFVIQGRPSLNETGYFELTAPPGFAGCLGDYRSSDRKSGRPEMAGKDDKEAEAWRLKGQGMSYRDIGSKLRVSKSTVANWFSKDEEIQ
jgi:hypothetical protein